MTYYNLTNITSQNSLPAALQSMNAQLNGLFFFGITICLWVILYASFKTKLRTTSALMASGIAPAIISIFLWAGGYLGLKFVVTIIVTYCLLLAATYFAQE